MTLWCKNSSLQVPLLLRGIVLSLLLRKNTSQTGISPCAPSWNRLRILVSHTDSASHPWVMNIRKIFKWKSGDFHLFWGGSHGSIKGNIQIAYISSHLLRATDSEICYWNLISSNKAIRKKNPFLFFVLVVFHSTPFYFLALFLYYLFFNAVSTFLPLTILVTL